MGLFKKDYIIGLDIGSSSVKMALFSRGEGVFSLLKTDSKEVKAVSDAEASDSAMVSAIRSLLKGVNLKQSKVIAAINCPKTCTRTVSVPHMPIKELGEGIKLTAREFFPFPIDESLVDFEILGDVMDKGVKKQRLMIATSPKATIDRMLGLLKKAGTRPYSIIPTPLALQKIVESSHPKRDEARAILDMGEHFSEFAIFSGKDLVFCRKIPINGAEFTKAMTGVLLSDMGKTALSMEDAERIKCQKGIPAEGESVIVENKISSIQILSMLRGPLEQLTSEIERCLDYYREETGEGKIDSLTLFGGGSSLKGLDKYLSKELGIVVMAGDPLQHIRFKSREVIANDDILHSISPAIGAALSFVKGVNLLPPELKEQTKRTFKRAGIWAAATAVILGLALVYVGLGIQHTNFETRIDVANREYTSILPHLKLAETQNMADSALAGEPYWEDVFKEISNLIPESIYLTEMKMEDGDIKLKGIIDSREGEELLSDFILTLEKGLFTSVKLITTKEIKKGMSEFSLKSRVD
ncbi:MAG: type IV pilus assembly protein PilM [Candidatus Omnitrophica bacterium]|nr:type IV pilus assembly protein PilM [Candidatus Omnitrophota bacterium]